MAEPSGRSLSAPGASEEAGPPRLWRDVRSAFRLVFLSPLGSFILCGLTFMGSLLILVGPQGIYSLTLVAPQRSRPWHVLFAIQPTLWMAAVLGVFSRFQRIGSVWPGTRRERMAILLCAVFAVPLITLPSLAHLTAHPSPLMAELETLVEVPHLQAKTLIFNTLGAVVGGLLGCVMLGVHVQLIGCLRRCPSLEEEPGSGSLQADVLRYQQLRSLLKRTLGFSAAIISSALLNIGAFRIQLNAAVPSQPELFPATATMGFGIYFTVVLASVYLPAATSLSQVGQVLADRLVRESPGRHGSWKTWSDEQQAVRTYLGLQGSALQDLQQGFALLAPFITGVSTLLLSTGR